MRKFRDQLRDLGLEYTQEVVYSSYEVPNAMMISNFLDDILSNPDAYVYIHPDRDLDGMAAATIIKETFDKLGFTNYYIPTHKFKSHDVESKERDEMLSMPFTHIIIVDSSTNDRQLQDSILASGRQLLIIDHHQPNYPEEEFSSFLLVNNHIESFIGKGRYKEASAGMLCYLVVSSYLKTKGLDANDDLRMLAYASMYADSMDMSDPDNIAFAYKTLEVYKEMPAQLAIFKNDFKTLSKDFILYSVSNKINALCRMDRYDVVHRLMYKIHELNHMEVGFLRDVINDIHLESKVLVNKLVEYANKMQVGDFVVADLTPAKEHLKNDESKIKNFTGYVASILSDEESLPALVYVNEGAVYKASIRDTTNNNLLYKVREFIEAGGHSNAFGFQSSRWGMEPLLNFIEGISIKPKSETFISIDFDSLDIFELKKTITIMSDYNEISGSALPEACLYKRINYRDQVYTKNNYTDIRHGDLQIVCFNKGVGQGSLLRVRPARGVNKVPKLYGDLIE